MHWVPNVFNDAPARFDRSHPMPVRRGLLRRRVELREDKFFTYDTNNGWNNQLLNLLCALDMARLLNRTLIVPPFFWTSLPLDQLSFMETCLASR